MRLRTLVLLALLGGTGCGAADPAPPDPASTVVLRPGERVLLTARGRTEEGAIVHVLSATHVVVKFDTDGAEEIVLAERLQKAVRRAPSVTYRPGEVLLLALPQARRFVLAEIVGPNADKYRVKYVGFEPPAFEDVPVDRLRRPFQGASAFNVGDVVTAKAEDGRGMKGTVAAVIEKDLWLVHFDGFGAQYDQPLGPERVSAWAPPPPPPPPEPKGPRFAVGQGVLAHARGVYHPGQVAGPGSGPGTYRVKFESAKLGEAEVAAVELVLAKELPKGAKLQGQAVLVEVHGAWLPAKVVKEGGKGLQVRFDGEPPTSDEVVPAKRVRLRPDAPTPP